MLVVILRLLALLLCSTLASSLAAAADKPLPLIPDWKQSQFVEGDPGIRSAYIFAVCSRNHRRAMVEALLETAPGSADESRLMPEAVPPGLTECPIRAERIKIRSRLFMRGALAEAIYNGDKRKPKVPSVPFDETFPEAARGDSVAVAHWVARCAVHRDLRRAHEVLQFNPGAVGERRALLLLGPTLAACLPAGERLQVTRLSFRALIAEELYHLSVSAKESFSHA